MKMWICAILFSIAGCFAEVTIETTSLLPTRDAGVGGEGGQIPIDSGIDTGIPASDAATGSELRADGSPCDFDGQCLHDACIPSKNTYGMGYCFSAETDGCLVVTEPSPHKAKCIGRTLYTCGDAFDVAQLGSSCEMVGAGDLFEFYYCCPNP